MRIERKRVLKRSLILLMAAAVLLGAVPMMNARADDFVDLDAECSVKVTSDSDEILADFKTSNAVVDLYLVADAVKVSGFDTYDFSVLPAYQSAVYIPDKPTNDDWDDLAQAAAGVVFGQGTPPAPTKSGVALSSISGLKAGMYLVVTRDAELKDYQTKTEDGKIVTLVNTDYYQYKIQPQLISLPTKEAVGGVISTAAPGPWLYEMTINLKMSRERRLGDLEIIKTLSSYQTGEDAFYVFDVTVTLEGVTEPVYSSVITLNFSQAGQKFARIEGLPAGADVVVTEEYNGSTYKLSSISPQTTQIVADTMVGVSFVNDYENHRRGGHGITNHFTYGNNDWSWNQQADNSAQ